MLKNNNFQPIATEFASPIVSAPKKDDSLRIFVEYQKSKAATARNSYVTHKMDAWTNSTRSANILLRLDVNSGYWPIDSDKSNIGRTAFVTDSVLYQKYVHVIRFGICSHFVPKIYG